MQAKSPSPGPRSAVYVIPTPAPDALLITVEATVRLALEGDPAAGCEVLLVGRARALGGAERGARGGGTGREVGPGGRAVRGAVGDREGGGRLQPHLCIRGSATRRCRACTSWSP